MSKFKECWNAFHQASPLLSHILGVFWGFLISVVWLFSSFLLKFRSVRCSRVSYLHVYQHLIKNTLFFHNYDLLEDGLSVASSAEMYDRARCMLVAVREKLSLDEDSDILTTSLRISLLCPVCTVYYYSIVAAAAWWQLVLVVTRWSWSPKLFSVDLAKPSCPVNSLCFDTFGRLAGWVSYQ